MSLILFFNLLSSSSQFCLSSSHILACWLMLSLSSYSLWFLSFIYWARKSLIFYCSSLCFWALLSSNYLCLISFSFSYLASIMSSNYCFLSILARTLSAILFMNSWARASLFFISLSLSASCFSSILAYSSWDLRSWRRCSSSAIFYLLLFSSFSRSIF